MISDDLLRSRLAAALGESPVRENPQTGKACVCGCVKCKCDLCEDCAAPLCCCTCPDTEDCTCCEKRDCETCVECQHCECCCQCDEEGDDQDE